VTWVLLAAAATSGALAITGEERGWRALVYVCKPLTTLLLLVVAAGGPAGESAYPWLIAAGLGASLAGDVFLMLPRDRFVAGLASFLLAHVLYGAAFFTVPRTMGDVLVLVLLGIVAAGIVAVLWAGLGRLRGPVLAYVATIIVMAWLACVRWRAGGIPGAGLAAIGALAFVTSDTLLALDRFRRPFPFSRTLVLGTYWVAQALIALSVGSLATPNGG